MLLKSNTLLTSLCQENVFKNKPFLHGFVNVFIQKLIDEKDQFIFTSVNKVARIRVAKY